VVTDCRRVRVVGHRDNSFVPSYLTGLAARCSKKV
jgi:hypothetical protein